MRRKRHQQGSLKVANRRYIAQFWDNGHRRNKTLGKLSESSKSEALDKLEEILRTIKSKQAANLKEISFGDFVSQIYFPFYCRMWKSDSTVGSNLDRIRHHLISEFGGRSALSLEPNCRISWTEKRQVGSLLAQWTT